MKTLEHEVIEKFRLLDEEAKKRVRQIIEQEIETEQQSDEPAFDFDAWLAEVKSIQIKLRSDANGCTPSASDLVNEVREERDADIR